ncbi:hypothetical protein UFOVP447_78 [uncultured Caudovirales phage]|uniref:Uncharacterized protein n=1 Tax=uncultured Caudovirales phage TaxID=2100421 RepID=A0A6J5M8V4_9CAUD|nr:hypothetical protein UFOVP447_78 [uncultured Caudovirales phage]
MALAANTVTTRPPLNLFEVERRQLQGNTWFQIVQVPSYFVPRNGPIAAKSVNAAAIMTGLTITNMHTATIRASARIRGVDGVYYSVVQTAPIPPNDFLSISFERQVMKTGEILEVAIPSNSTPSANHAHVHFSYILNQREEFTIL